MRFQYDPSKAAANLRKHGVSFADAEGALEDPLAITVEDPDSEGEARFITVGLGNAVVRRLQLGARGESGRCGAVCR